MVNGITARLFMPITILMVMIASRKKIAILTGCTLLVSRLEIQTRRIAMGNTSMGLLLKPK